MLRVVLSEAVLVRELTVSIYITISKIVNDSFFRLASEIYTWVPFTTNNLHTTGILDSKVFILSILIPNLKLFNLI